MELLPANAPPFHLIDSYVVNLPVGIMVAVIARNPGVDAVLHLGLRLSRRRRFILPLNELPRRARNRVGVVGVMPQLPASELSWF